MVIGGSEKGYVYSMDCVGPYSPDIDGNIHGSVGVETGHTNYGMTSLTKNKESNTSLQGFKIHRNKLRQIGQCQDDKDIVRLHHDCDKSFEGELKQYLIDENIEDTDTGGYNPSANSRVERGNWKQYHLIRGPSHNKWCVKSHFFLEHFKSVPDGQRLNIVVAHTGSVGTESVGPFLRLNSALAHVDAGPCSCLHPRIKCGMEK